MLASDNLDAAIVQEAVFQDDRLSQYWDGERVLGRLVSCSLALSGPVAWDIYLLYSYGTIWKGEMMPTPDFWMHQLNERPDRYLGPPRLMAEVQKAIEAISYGGLLND